MSGIDPIFLISGALAVMAVIAVEVFYLMFSKTSEKRGQVNRRLRGMEDGTNQQDLLMKLRKERGIGEGGSLLGGLSNLYTQSGMTTGFKTLILYCTAFGLLAGALSFMYIGNPTFSAGLAVVLILLSPIMVMRHKRNKRLREFSNQFPEALELIVRSLKAGHPVPVAVSMVAREMHDPIGTEFGMVADEVTYGSTLVTALNALYDRVGEEDLPLFITAVSIQSSSGGNLREILEGLSDVIRGRMKLRRKIHAISSEGRISANFLSALPILFLIAINFMQPGYYTEMAGELMLWKGMFGAFCWMMFGNFVIRRMVNFKF